MISLDDDGDDDGTDNDDDDDDDVSGLKSHPIGGSDMGVRLLKEKVGAYVGTLLYQ